MSRTASIITNSSCVFGIIKKNIFDQALKESSEKHKKLNLSFILNTHLFFGLDICNIQMYYNQFVFQSVNKGTKIVEEGNFAKYVYCIRSGEFESSIMCLLSTLEILIKSYGGNTYKENEVETDIICSIVNKT